MHSSMSSMEVPSGSSAHACACSSAGDRMWLTQAGAGQVTAATGALVSRIVEKLASSPLFEGGPDHSDVEAALERIAARLLVQREWDDRGAVPETATPAR